MSETISPFVRQLPKPSFSMPAEHHSLTVLGDLIQAGKITYLQSGPASGKVVITVP